MGIASRLDLLVRLVLDRCFLETLEVRDLFDCLHYHRSLQYLDLEGNSIDSDIATPMSEMLRHNTTLLSLSVNLNNVGSRTAIAVAMALLQNTTLKSLGMNKSGINDDGALAFSRNIPMMSGLRYLDLAGNQISSVGSKALAVAMQENRKLHSLQVHSCDFECNPRIHQEINFYGRRNQIGWRPLESPTPFDEALWPHVLAKVSSDPSMLFFFICQVCTITSHANFLHNTEMR